MKNNSTEYSDTTIVR